MLHDILYLVSKQEFYHAKCDPSSSFSKKSARILPQILVRSFAVPFSCGLFSPKKSNSRSNSKTRTPVLSPTNFSKSHLSPKNKRIFSCGEKNCGSPAFLGVEFQTLPVLFLGKIVISVLEIISQSTPGKKQGVLSVLSNYSLCPHPLHSIFCPNVSDTKKNKR